MSSALSAFDLKKFNSATKYPSILTYHELGEKGRLKDVVQVPFSGPTLVTEKIDGTNARIIFYNGDYFIGSREEILHARGDRIYNPAQGIVAVAQPVAERLAFSLSMVDHNTSPVITMYGEVYGGKTTASKAYGTSTGFRVFDIVTTPAKEFADLIEMDSEAIARWRNNGGQNFRTEEVINRYATLANVGVTPRLTTSEVPTDLVPTYEWLKALLPGATQAPLEGDIKGEPEGVVIRTPDRKSIAKIRFEDYKRTLRTK